MIGKLYGIIDEIEKDYIILNVNNIGYIVYVTKSALKNFNIGNNVSLLIETYMREDQIKLYGFENKEELAILRILIKVKGVSHKIAANIISEIPSYQIIQGIVSKNPILLKATGVGVKLANRIITELEETVQKEGITQDDTLIQDAISALINLGYSSNDSYKMIHKVKNENPKVNNINGLIRHALKTNEER